MRAIVGRRYGPPDVLEQVELDAPVPAEDQVLVRVHAAGINPYDLHNLYGDPYLARPMIGLGLRKPRKPTILGSDIAGVVEAVGSSVTRFSPGDEVYGTVSVGGLAEFVAAREKVLARKPSNLSFEQAAAVGMAALTALQALRDSGKLQAGQTVIVNGASGGVGSFAVQLACALGASAVTGICSTGNVDLVRSLGASDVVDYTREDFTKRPQRYDLLLDTAGNRTLRSFASVVVPKGVVVLVGAGSGRIAGPLGQIVRAKLQSPFVKPRVAIPMARVKSDDLEFVTELIEAGRVVPAIDRVYPFAEAADAFRRLETRHARGKIVIAV